MKTILLLALVAFAPFALGQKLLTPGDLSASTSVLPKTGVKVDFVYDFHPLYPGEAPATIVWYWGDDERDEKGKLVNASMNHAEYKWANGLKPSHVFAKPGSYTVLIVVNDARNFNLRQQSIAIKIREPFQVCPCD